MAVGIADVHKSIQSAWSAHGIDWEFKKYWVEADRTEYETIHDQEATPTQPFPYCVYELATLLVESRDSGHDVTEKHQTLNIPCDFKVYAKKTGNQSPKVVAAALAEVLLGKFGGHPTVKPVQLVLDNGNVLLMQYQSEMSIREGDDEYSWMISYSIKVDVPVKVG